MSTEFVYKLNLPSLHNVINLHFFETIKKLCNNKKSFYKKYLISDYLIPEYKKICDIEFHSMTIFYKNNVSGIIHTDIPDLSGNSWGINWVENGQCVMEFWTKESIGCEPISLIDMEGATILKWNRKFAKPPLRTYVMNPGAYLVNAAAIHRPAAIGKRFVVSIRSNSQNFLSWDNAVNLFNPIIKGVPDVSNNIYEHIEFMEPN